MLTYSHICLPFIPLEIQIQLTSTEKTVYFPLKPKTPDKTKKTVSALKKKEQASAAPKSPAKKAAVSTSKEKKQMPKTTGTKAAAAVKKPAATTTTTTTTTKGKVPFKTEITQKLQDAKNKILQEVSQKVRSESNILKHEIGDIYDIASNERERELTLSLGDRDREKLANIEDAFERIRENTYGECEEWGEPIAA